MDSIRQDACTNTKQHPMPNPTNHRPAGYDERLADEPYPTSPGLWPIRHAAEYAGLSVNGLEAGIENGDIPVLMRRIGPSGKRFVNVEQLRAWVGGKPEGSQHSASSHEENLF